MIWQDYIEKTVPTATDRERLRQCVNSLFAGSPFSGWLYLHGPGCSGKSTIARVLYFLAQSMGIELIRLFGIENGKSFIKKNACGVLESQWAPRHFEAGRFLPVQCVYIPQFRGCRFNFENNLWDIQEWGWDSDGQLAGRK